MISAAVIIGVTGAAAVVMISSHDGVVSEELNAGTGAVAATLWGCVALSCGVLHRVSNDRRAVHVGYAAGLTAIGALSTSVLVGHSATTASAAALVNLPAAVHLAMLGRSPEIDMRFSTRRCAAITVLGAAFCVMISLVAGLPPRAAAVIEVGAWTAGAGVLLHTVRRQHRHLMWWLVICGHGMVIAAVLQIEMTAEGVVASSTLSALVAGFAFGGVMVEVRRAYADQQRGAVAALAEAAVATMRAQAVEDTEAERLHEARAALAGIGAAAESLSRYRDLLEPRQFDDLSTGMVQEVARLKELIAHDAISSVEHSLDVAEAIRPAITCARAAGLEVTSPLPAGLLARSSPGVLSQVVTALLANAARHAPGSPVEIDVSRRDDTVVVTVADRGPGLRDEMCDRIFTRGVSTGGSGLGLYLARNQLAAIGGSITASARSGGGALFRVALPVADGVRSGDDDRDYELRAG